MENVIEIKDTINLSDGNEYVVCSKVDYEDKWYLYLIDINNMKNIKFCEEVKEKGIIKVVEVKNEALLKTLLPLFYEAGKDVLEEFRNEE